MLMTVVFYQCSEDMLSDEVTNNDLKSKRAGKGKPAATFTVKIENISTVYDYFEAGAKFVPDGESSAGPAFPGHSFTVKFHAGRSHRLSFASMYGASNDLFYAPSDAGIKLFDGDGNPTTGNITGMISLWDAGTEVNHAPGSGEDGAEESAPVQSVRNTDNKMDGFSYNSVEENIEVLLSYDGVSEFTLNINVLPGSSTPLSPVAWVVHSDMQKPIFTEGAMDYGLGLEDLAEMGNAAPLSENLSLNSGYVSPIAPGAWVLHKQGQKPVFDEGKPDYGKGLEMLSEMGDPVGLITEYLLEGFETGIFNIPVGASDPAPLFPGETYTFTFEANPGDYLSFATMLGKSNDLFLSLDDMGIPLFKGYTPIKGDITGLVSVWDAGTEVNEYPGAGIHQGPGGIDEHKDIMVVNDEFMWPEANDIVRVVIFSEPNTWPYPYPGMHNHPPKNKHWKYFK